MSVIVEVIVGVTKRVGLEWTTGSGRREGTDSRLTRVGHDDQVSSLTLCRPSGDREDGCLSRHGHPESKQVSHKSVFGQSDGNSLPRTPSPSLYEDL